MHTRSHAPSPTSVLSSAPQSNARPATRLASSTGNASDHAPDTRRQVFLLEPDTGTLCRILSLYAARGLSLARMQLEHAAPLTLMLVVYSTGGVDCLRILVDKARSLPGVIEAAGD